MTIVDHVQDTIERTAFVVEKNRATIARVHAALERGQERTRVTEMRLNAFRLRQEAAEWAHASQENREIALSLDDRDADDLRTLKLLIKQTTVYQNMGELLLDRARELEGRALNFVRRIELDNQY